MSSYYDDEDDVDIHVRHRGHSPRPPPPPPAPIRYVASPSRGRDYFPPPMAPSYLVPNQRTTMVARSRSRDRERSRERPTPPIPTAPANPVIINNRFYNDYSSDDDHKGEHRRKSQVSRHRRRSRSRSSSRSRSHSRSRSYSHSHAAGYMSREDWEAEQARRELEQMRVTHAKEKDERRMADKYKDDADLRRAKRELDEIKGREARVEEEKRIKKELELKRLKEEEEEAEEKKRREKEAAEAVEAYKQKESKRIAREKQLKEEADKDYQRRLHDDLLKSGLDEKSIAAILKKEKIPEASRERERSGSVNRPTYTRMARRHLSIETLRTFRVEFDYDNDPDFVLVKRWVPEWEQDQFWRHTRLIRDKRGKTLMIEEKKHHHKDADFEWVRKKERRRSKSPGVLMYLAGARPS